MRCIVVTTPTIANASVTPVNMSPRNDVRVLIVRAVMFIPSVMVIAVSRAQSMRSQALA